MPEEKFQLLKELLKQESANKLEIKKLMFTLTTVERNEMINHLSPEEQKNLLRLRYQLNLGIMHRRRGKHK